MNAPDFTPSGRARRLFADAVLEPGAVIALDKGQSNYVLNVVRLRPGDEVLVFNGRDGEWRARLAAGRRKAALEVHAQTRAQSPPGDLHYLFAPLKHARLDYLVQKATEMGASHLAPVMTARTVAGRVNAARMRANAIEAAEQCGLLQVPSIADPAPLDAILDGWPGERALVFADEAAPARAPLAALRAVAGRPLAVIVGPEGGFSPEERARLLELAPICPVWLGPRIMRADTAAVAVLTLVQAVCGDWRQVPDGGRTVAGK